ncbi:hypothetical protein [Bacillus phage phiAGATE]|uniref:Uncharacterized protein n=1 Tax=Bacillus phage phiAGATE TaxID=1204533 RepID=L0L8E4_9CAUD|nr:ocr-like anti-restriction [Bacillus phage phiAGATE]AGB62674.1 hypothetical protein [Bacillus phage phiAGATE]
MFYMLETTGYRLIGILEDEVDALQSLENEYDGNTYIGDAITEIADSFSPTYDSKLWKNAEHIEEYIEEAVSSGLVDTSNFNLTKMFQAGYYVYYTESLYKNLDAVLYNYSVNLVNEELKGKEVSQGVYENIAADLDELCTHVNNNDTFDQFDSKVMAILEEHTTA